MSKLEVVPVRWWWQRRQFLNLPWQIYKGDQYWVPPLRMQAKEMVNYTRHPFYDDAKIETFLAKRDGKVVGRIAAIVNHAHNRQYQEKRGFFGFFECTNDQEAAHALFTAARDWLMAQGMTAVRGPCNPSLNYECGLLVDGFDSSPTFMMTYNPPYYGELIESFGFQKTQDLYAFWGHVDMIAGLDKKLTFVVEECNRRFDIKLRRLDRNRFNEDVKTFLDIYNQSLVGTWGFVPLSDAEVKHMGKGLKMLIVPEMTTIGEVDGKIFGACFAMLDYNPRIKEMGGRLFPFGFLKLLFNRRALTRIRVLSTNVVPEYQRWGLGLVIVARLLPEVLAWGVKEAEFSWVLESNSLSFGTLKRAGAKITKTYRLYDLEFAPKLTSSTPTTS
ncbi:conserved hypothetical protein [Pirellula staleyi DSM 6068]|uniref:N-acetyltransferase domain-containing protein n=1 Tax=Pirellula staleyi (strain ATCC 27377 / DSM 6068 / ICPB 4128) TaxID=530564 RepID=D2R862_PIRSD|nr:hypothetical protein [Pirellula staleyi]ADB15679.1 conserved hypothetical protein [Pirellula staleyi DSM 6068]